MARSKSAIARAKFTPGGVEVPAAGPGLGVVRVEPERRVEVGQGTIEVAQSPAGLGPGAVQLGVAGGERAEEGDRAFLARVQRPVEVGDGVAEIAQGQPGRGPDSGTPRRAPGLAARLVAVGDRPLVIAPRGVEVQGAAGADPGVRRVQSQGRLEVGLRGLVKARQRRADARSASMIASRGRPSKARW